MTTGTATLPPEGRRPAALIRATAGPALMAIGLFAALTAARTAGITENFWLLGEQIRDWTFALGPWSDLPLSGTPSTVGGRSLGPVYYWTLWGIRVTVGPFFDNLPHAGGVGLSMIQSAADVVLFFAVRRHTGSAPLALAVILLGATAAYDMTLNATIWNPPLSVALVKLALALFLWSANHPSPWRMTVTVATAWLAVQAHSSAIFVFAPLASWFVVRAVAARQWRRAADTVRLLLEVLLVLQIPYLIDRLTSPGQGTPTVALEALTRVAGDPLSAAPAKAFDAIGAAMTFFWVHPFEFAPMGLLLIAAAVACAWASRRHPWVLFVTIGPMAMGVAAFSGWTRPFDHYWFLTLSPPLALMVGEALRALPQWRARELLATSFLMLVLYAQPARMLAVKTLHKLPEYGPLVHGTREIARRTPEIRNIFTDFELPESTDSTFPFVCLGGRVTTGAAYNAFIARDGRVSFRSTQQ